MSAHNSTDYLDLDVLTQCDARDDVAFDIASFFEMERAGDLDFLKGPEMASLPPVASSPNSKDPKAIDATPGTDCDMASQLEEDEHFDLDIPKTPGSHEYPASATSSFPAENMNSLQHGISGIDIGCQADLADATEMARLRSKLKAEKAKRRALEDELQQMTEKAKKRKQKAARYRTERDGLQDRCDELTEKLVREKQRLASAFDKLASKDAAFEKELDAIGQAAAQAKRKLIVAKRQITNTSTTQTTTTVQSAEESDADDASNANTAQSALDRQTPSTSGSTGIKRKADATAHEPPKKKRAVHYIKCPHCSTIVTTRNATRHFKADLQRAQTLNLGAKVIKEIEKVIENYNANIDQFRLSEKETRAHEQYLASKRK